MTAGVGSNKASGVPRRGGLPAACALTVAAAVSLPILVGFGGCERHKPTATADGESSRAKVDQGLQVITASTTHAGKSPGEKSSTLGLELDVGDRTVAERMRLQLTLVGPSAEAPEWPAWLESIEGLRVIDIDDDGPSAETDGRVRFTRTMVFEPFLPGTRTIPAIELGKLRLEPIEVEVRPLVEDPPTDVESLVSAVGDDVGLAAVPERPPLSPWVWAQLAAGGVMVGVPLAAFSLALVRMRRPMQPVAPLVRLSRALDALGDPRGASAMPAPEALDEVHSALRGVLAEELGSAAHGLSAAELVGVVAAQADGAIRSPQSPHARVVVPPDWSPPHDLRSRVVSAVENLERARFAPLQSTAERHAAWLASYASLRALADELKQLRTTREADRKRGVRSRSAPALAAGRAA